MERDNRARLIEWKASPVDTVGGRGHNLLRRLLLGRFSTNRRATNRCAAYSHDSGIAGAAGAAPRAPDGGGGRGSVRAAELEKFAAMADEWWDTGV